MRPTSIPATRISTAELSWLLSLRPGPSASMVAAALGLSQPSADPQPGADVLRDLLAAGRAQQRRGELLPRGESAVVGDVLTSTRALITVGTEHGPAAVLAVGTERVLLVAPAGPDVVEVAALDATTTPGVAAGTVASRVGQHACVTVTLPQGESAALDPGPALAERVQGMLP